MFSCLSINYDFCHCDFCLVRCCTIIGLGQYIHLIIKLFYMVSWHPYIAPDVCDGQCSCFQAWSNQHIVCHPWQDHTICLWSTLMARCLDHGCWTFDLRSLQHQHAFPKSSSGSEAIGSSLGSNSPWTAVLYMSYSHSSVYDWRLCWRFALPDSFLFLEHSKLFAFILNIAYH